MSGLIVGLTFRRLPVDDHPMLLVALALAEQADSEGRNIFPSVDLVAVETRLSRRSVQYQIRDLQELGFLILMEKGGGRKNPNRWAIDVAWLERQPDRVKVMRAEKEAKNQSSEKGAPPALIQPVDNVGLPAVDKPPQIVHKRCTKRAPAGAPNPPTPVPFSKPPPLHELVEAALWAADRSKKPPINRGAYKAGLVKRIGLNADESDISTWRKWLRWQEEQHLAAQRQVTET